MTFQNFIDSLPIIINSNPNLNYRVCLYDRVSDQFSLIHTTRYMGENDKDQLDDGIYICGKDIDLIPSEAMTDMLNGGTLFLNIWDDIDVVDFSLGYCNSFHNFESLPEEVQHKIPENTDFIIYLIIKDQAS